MSNEIVLSIPTTIGHASIQLPSDTFCIKTSRIAELIWDAKLHDYLLKILPPHKFIYCSFWGGMTCRNNYYFLIGINNRRHGCPSSVININYMRHVVYSVKR